MTDASKIFAIVCDRVLAGEPPLYACREAAAEDDDSGWQFVCGSDEHDGEDAEGAHLIDLAKLVDDYESLRRVVELPAGAELERSTSASAWCRIDIEDRPAGSFACHACGEQHDELPMDVAFDVPDAYLDEAQFPRDGWELTSDTAVFRGEHHFVRGVVEVAILDSPGPLCYGVWVSASSESFAQMEALEPEDEETIDGPFFGWFANSIRGYPETANLKVHTWVRGGGLRPLVELEPTDHPLAVEQRHGITLARLHELVAGWS